MIQENELKYCIWGTGLESVQATYSLPKDAVIECYIDKKKLDDINFMGRPVRKLNELTNPKSFFYLIAVKSRETFLEISAQLQNIGMKEYESFIHYTPVQGGVCILHGNCHMSFISAFLKSSKEFKTKYSIADIPPIFEIKKEISPALLKICSLFIHEDIRPDNQFGYKLSDEYILPQLNRNCKIICVPNLFGFGEMFYPNYVENKKNFPLLLGTEWNGMFPHGCKIIEEGLSLKKTVDEIFIQVSSPSAIPKKDIIRNFKSYIEKLEKREKNWDIKIVNFIKKNYKKVQLFYDRGHPTNFLMEEICRELLALLGMNGKGIHINWSMDTHEEFVYPCVKSTLKLRWSQFSIRNSSSAKKMTATMNLHEYVNEYVYWRTINEICQ